MSAPAADIRQELLPQRYLLVDTFDNSLPVPGVYHPEGVALSPDGIMYVAETGNHRVSSWLINGDADKRWGSRGPGRGQFEAPEDVAVDADLDRLYVADTGNRRVQVLNRRTGVFQDSWTDVGLPRGVAVASDGTVYVSDADGHRVLAFDPEGSLVGTLGEPGRDDGQLDAPLGVSVGPDGLVYVADSGNQRVQWFEASGAFSGLLSLDSRAAPGGIPRDVGVDAAGDLYVAVDRGLLRYRGRTKYSGVEWPLVPVDEDAGTEEPVPRTGNHEGVRRLDVSPDVGIAFTYAPSLLAGDQINVLPARWYPTTAGVAESWRHAYDPHRIDSDGTQVHVLDTSGLLRIYGQDGTWRNERQAYPGGPGIDIAGFGDSTAVLRGNTATVTSLICPNFECPQREIAVLDDNMMTRYNKVNERVPDDRWWNTALVSTFTGWAFVDTGRARLVMRTDGGELLGAESLNSHSEPFRAWRDVADTWDGTMWALARDGELRRIDRRGRDLDSVFLDGLEGRAAEALAIAEVGDGPEIFVLTSDEWVFKFAVDGQPLAAWSIPDAAGPGRYTDVTTDAFGRVLVPDGAADRVLVFEQVSGPADGPVPDPRGPRCTVVPSKSASPSRLPLGATTDVTLEVEGDCGSAQATLDIVLVLDRGCFTFRGDRARRIKEGAQAFVAALDTDRDRVAIVTYPDEIGAARLRVPFTSDKAVLSDSLQSWSNLCFYPDSGTMSDGLRVAREALTGPHAREGAGKAVVLVSQGYERDEGMWEARQLWRMGAQLHTVAGGPDQYDAGELADDGLLASMADLPQRYRHGDAPSDMLAVWQDLTAEITDRVLFPELEIVDELPDNMRLVPGSVSPPAEALPDGSLRWRFTDVGFDGPPAISYTVEPLDAGQWPTNVQAEAVYIDGLDYPGRAVFPVPYVDVIPPETPTSTPTETLEPTPTPDVSPTPTASVTPVVSPPPAPSVLYLPWLDKPRCKPSQIPVDVALLIDTSSSMEGDKLSAAVEAARGFLGLLALPRDQAAVVTFDSDARAVQPLTGDGLALSRALEGLTTAQGTRIDLGLRDALEQVDGLGSRISADGVIVLLTDGRPEPGTEEHIELYARVAQRVGVTVYAIGLGDDVLPDVLETITGEPERVYLAPTPDDLAEIYKAIARTIPCR
ncbi:MAG: VWA domain-containing protein [Anaerolineae bacterium]